MGEPNPDRAFYGHNSGTEVKSDSTVFDVVAWRESMLSKAMIAGKNSNFFLEAGKGNITGYGPIFFTGENENLDETEQTLMARGGLYEFPSSAATVDVVSSDANDTAAGTGAQSIALFGLDSDYNEISEVVSTNGTSISTSTSLFLRVNGMSVASKGSGDSNIGTIDAKHGSNILSQILPDEGQARQAVQTVPAGHTWFPQGNHFSCGRADEVVMLSSGFAPSGLKLLFSKVYLYQNQFPFRNENIVPFPEKFDISLNAIRFNGTQSKAASFLQFFEVDNNEF